MAAAGALAGAASCSGMTALCKGVHTASALPLALADELVFDSIAEESGGVVGGGGGLQLPHVCNQRCVYTAKS